MRLASLLEILRMQSLLETEPCTIQKEMSLGFKFSGRARLLLVGISDALAQVVSDLLVVVPALLLDLVRGQVADEVAEDGHAFAQLVEGPLLRQQLGVDIGLQTHAN